MNQKPFKIGTRNSPLALRQADILKSTLEKAHPDLIIEIVPVISQADWKKEEGEKPLSEEAGGKGLFAKEIENALLSGQVDCGVHSLKDMASFLPDGLMIHHVLPRANPHDAFISTYKNIQDLPEGATVGSCSARRSAMILSKRPDIKIVPFRGNVQTRLDKIQAGQVDATFLAMAGLTRLGIHHEMINPLTADEMLPACGQGVICMEVRQDDKQAQQILDEIHCLQTGLSAFAEREVLKALDGSCHTPIAAFAVIEGGALFLRAEVYSLDGAQVFKDQIKQNCINNEQAIVIGQKLGARLKDKLPHGILL